MKKILFIVTCILFILSFSFATNNLADYNTDHLDKIVMVSLDDLMIPIKTKNIIDEGCVTLYLPGVCSTVKYDGVEYSTSETDLDVMVKLMIENAPNCKQVLVAHSQGGLRAIAYANMMQQLGYGDRIKAIIFIGSPVRGFAPLVDGIDALKEKVQAEIDIIDAGFNSVVAAVNGLSINDVDVDEWLRDIKSAVMHPLDTDSLLYQVFGFSDAVLHDMNPAGDFVKKYVGVNFDPYTFESQTGIHKIPCSPVIPDNIRLGFVVGKNNDPLDFIENEFERFAAEFALDNAGNVLDAVNEWHEFLAWISFASADGREVHETHAKNARNFKSLINNFQSRYGKLLGDTNHDCLIASYTQYREIHEIGGTPISPNEYIVNVSDAIHALVSDINEFENNKIWGTGQGFGKNIGTQGIIPDWYNELKNQGVLTASELAEAKTNIQLF